MTYENKYAGYLINAKNSQKANAEKYRVFGIALDWANFYFLVLCYFMIKGVVQLIFLLNVDDKNKRLIKFDRIYGNQTNIYRNYIENLD